MGEVRWRLVGDVETLRQKSCWRLRCDRRSSASTAPRDLVLVYVAKVDKFFALDGACSHMGGPLYNGDIEECNGRTRIVCPWHGYAFDLQTGMTDFGLPQTTYEVKVESGKVYVNHSADLTTRD